VAKTKVKETVQVHLEVQVAQTLLAFGIQPAVRASQIMFVVLKDNLLKEY